MTCYSRLCGNVQRSLTCLLILWEPELTSVSVSSLILFFWYITVLFFYKLPVDLVPNNFSYKFGSLSLQQVFLLLLGHPPTLLSSMVGTVWPSQCSGSLHSMMVGLQSTTPSLSVQASVQSPPVEQVFQSLCPTMWYTLSILWPPTAMGAAVLPWLLYQTSVSHYNIKVMLISNILLQWNHLSEHISIPDVYDT